MAEYDLISKTALLRHLDMAVDCEDCPRNTDRKTYYERCACSEVADICNTITNFATFADVQPVRRGRWIHFNDDGIIFCTECKHEAYWDTDYGQQLFDYCPYCGARMTKDGDTNGRT